MLNISYTPKDMKTAEEMQKDLTAAVLRLDHSILIVLLNAEALADKDLLKAIESAQREKHLIVPVLLQEVALPVSLQGTRTLDLSKGYDKNKLISFVKNADLDEDVKVRNRRLLFYVGGAALLVFAISIASLASGIVAAPNDEFATENALQDAQIETVTAPELELVRPRSTEDALNFPATVDAARRNLQPFLMGTATAIPLEQRASEEAYQTRVYQTATAIAEQGNTASPEAEATEE
jgi:hypothetical protein